MPSVDSLLLPASARTPLKSSGAKAARTTRFQAASQSAKLPGAGAGTLTCGAARWCVEVELEPQSICTGGRGAAPVLRI
jgi:hypothetical protein